MDVPTRCKIVDKFRYCENCLAKSHDLRACPCLNTCRICDEFHHTLLHPSVKSRLSQKRVNYRNTSRGSKHRASTAIKKRAHSKRIAMPSVTTFNRKRRSPSPSTINSEQRTNIKPNKKILSEAIRSLAEVLCVQQE